MTEPFPTSEALNESLTDLQHALNARNRKANIIAQESLEQKSEPGIRFDAGKLRFDLLPPDALSELVAVYTDGAAKYSPRNWEKGMSWGRCLGALLRHVFAWMRGEQNDPESGHHHLAHAAWGCLALITYERHNIGTDDRFLEDHPK